MTSPRVRRITIAIRSDALHTPPEYARILARTHVPSGCIIQDERVGCPANQMNTTPHFYPQSPIRVPLFADEIHHISPDGIHEGRDDRQSVTMGNRHPKTPSPLFATLFLVPSRNPNDPEVRGCECAPDETMSTFTSAHGFTHVQMLVSSRRNEPCGK